MRMESFGMRRAARPVATLTLGALVAGLLGFGVVAASKPKDKAALADQDVKELLLLMDTDNNGKISKAEYMKFMETEFDRLDVDRSGELDPKELTQASFKVVHSGHR